MNISAASPGAISACTDITGFGLAGHLTELLRHSPCVAELTPEAIPTLPGVMELQSRGIYSSLFANNLQAFATDVKNLDLRKLHHRILFDPQTSGGLLIAMREAELPRLEQNGIEFVKVGTILGSATPDGFSSGKEKIVLPSEKCGYTK
jgi:selenide,water dikinase